MTEKEKIDNLGLTIYELDLSVRSTNALLRAGYKTLKDIVKANVDDIRGIRNLGNRSFKEIMDKVCFYGYPTLGIDTNDLNVKPLGDVFIIEAAIQVKNVPSLDGYDYSKIINLIRDFQREHNFGEYEIRPGWTLTYHPDIEVLYIKFRLGYTEPTAKED